MVTYSYSVLHHWYTKKFSHNISTTVLNIGCHLQQKSQIKKYEVYKEFTKTKVLSEIHTITKHKGLKDNKNYLPYRPFFWVKRIHYKVNNPHKTHHNTPLMVKGEVHPYQSHTQNSCCCFYSSSRYFVYGNIFGQTPPSSRKLGYLYNKTVLACLAIMIFLPTDFQWSNGN